MDKRIWIAGGIVVAAVGLTAGYLYMESDRKKKLDAQKKAIDFKLDPAAGTNVPLKPVGGGSSLYQGKLPIAIAKPAPGMQRKVVNFRNYNSVPYPPGNFCCDNF